MRLLTRHQNPLDSYKATPTPIPKVEPETPETQTARFRRFLRVIAIFVVLLGLAGVSIMARQNRWKTHQNALYTIDLPAGWTISKVEAGNPSYETYTGPKGFTFTVVIFPAQKPAYGEYEADRSWELAWADAARTRYRVISEGLNCDPTHDPGGFCLVGNHKLEIHAAIRNAKHNDLVTSDHEYQFEFGNLLNEDADTGVLEKILERFKVKATAGSKI